MFLHEWHLHIWPVRGGEMGPDYRDAFRVQTASLYNLEIQIQVQIHDMMGPDFSCQSECIGEECITYDLKILIKIQIQIHILNIILTNIF